MYHDCPNNFISQDIYKRGINLPSYFEMTEDDTKYVVDAINKELVI